MKCSQCVKKYETGIGWGDVKKELFRVVDRELAGPREKYAMYMNEPNLLYEALEKGAERAREIAKANLVGIKKRIGFERDAERSLVLQKKPNEISICYQYRVRRDRNDYSSRVKSIVIPNRNRNCTT